MAKGSKGGFIGQRFSNCDAPHVRGMPPAPRSDRGLRVNKQTPNRVAPRPAFGGQLLAVPVIRRHRIDRPPAHEPQHRPRAALGVVFGCPPKTWSNEMFEYLPHVPGVDIIMTTLPRWGWGGGGGLEPGGSDDGMTITITISSGSSGKDDSGLQAILAKCVKK